MKIIQESIDLAKVLNTTAEVVAYIRPRLLGEFYKGDYKMLRERTAKHLEGSLLAEKNSLKALDRKLKAIEKGDNPSHKDNCMKKIQEIKFSNEQRHKFTIPLYEAVIKFLDSVTEDQIKLIMDKGGEKAL